MADNLKPGAWEFADDRKHTSSIERESLVGTAAVCTGVLKRRRNGFRVGASVPLAGKLFQSNRALRSTKPQYQYEHGMS